VCKLSKDDIAILNTVLQCILCIMYTIKQVYNKDFTLTIMATEMLIEISL